ncbi:MAG: GNAT family N-acetyltransferase [Cytophagales bacterium]|nr:GNAT family N-acetyltransferase [Rhizobacter sp.]
MSVSSAVQVQQLDAATARAEIDALCELLIDTVTGGASVGFIEPMSQAKARAFWKKVAAGVAQGERVLFVARNAAGRIDGTVQLLVDMPENQPHRAEVAKLQVHRRARKHGVGHALMSALEAKAADLHKTLLVLDTASADAERLYERLGWQRCGVIPGFALLPAGGLCATVFFYKAVAGATPPVTSPTA